MGNGGCCKFRRRRVETEESKAYEPLLHQEEKEAVNNLLKYYDEENFKLTNLSSDQLKALTVLSYSDNEELQRTAAYFFSEISEQYTQEVSEVILAPLVHLLSSLDNEVLRAASLALSSLALYGPGKNKAAIVRSGGLLPLIKLLRSDQVEVLCNVCGCLTTLATEEQNKIEIVKLGGLHPLIRLTKARDIRVKRNSAGALLNLSHVAANRISIVGEGGVPYLVQLLESQDEEIQFYCSATLSNIAVDGGHRSVIMSVSNGKVLSSLVRLIQNGIEKVQCQACLALRNLASDETYQSKIFNAGALDVIYELLIALPNHTVDTIVAATAALKNISIHQGSEAAIVNKKLVPVLCSLLKQDQYEEARCHAAGTIRNVISVPQAVQSLVMAGGVNLLLKIVTSNQNDALLVECSAALAIAASHAEVGHMILESTLYTKLLKSLANYTVEIAHNIVGVLGHLAANAANHDKLLSHDPSLLAVVSMVTKMETSDGTSCNFLSLWILAQLSVGSNQTKAALQRFLNKDSALSEWVCQQQSTASGDSRQLAAMVMGITSSSTSSSLLTSLSDNLTASQKLPSDPSLLRGFENERTKGNSLLRKGYFNDAILHYTKCIELCPSMPSSYSNRALCYIRMGKFHLAEKDCTTSLLLDPTNVKVLFRRSLARKGLSHYKDALKDIDALLKLDPNNSTAEKERDILQQLQSTDEGHTVVDL